MKNLKELHDYVKTNYEAGSYHASEQDYHKWQTEYDNARHSQESKENKLTDYQMGYLQATDDYQNNHPFRSYPAAVIEFGDFISHHRLREIVDFISGYNDAKNELQRQI